MARAKRTDRADARRRYRQYQPSETDEVALDEETAAPRAAAAPKATPAPAERPSIMAAFRNAYHPAHIREDIGYLPSLLRSRGFLVSLGLVLAGAVAIAIAPRNEITLAYFSYVVFDPRSGSPGFLPIMLVGFLASRASYLLGLILALVDVAIGAWFAYAIAPLLVENAADALALQAAIPSTAPLAASFGILFAAAAAWYRRFLRLSNPGAAARARARQQQRAKEQRAKEQQRARAGKPARS